MKKHPSVDVHTEMFNTGISVYPGGNTRVQVHPADESSVGRNFRSSTVSYYPT